MKIVEVEMTGGLGNQLFKWSNGFRIAQELNATLILNTSFYERLQRSPLTSSRTFELNQFPQIKQTFFEIKKRGFLNPRFERLGHAAKLVNIVREDSLRTVGDRPYSVIKGNFEALRYLPDRDLVRQLFNSAQKSEWLIRHQKLMSQNQVVVIHIRLGDFLKFPETYNILPERYYLEAVKIARKHFANAEIWLFTDDLKTAKKKFTNLIPKTDMLFGDPNIQPREILSLMSKANGIVCANSTFSWWASFLAKNETLSILPSRFNLIPDDKTAESLQMPTQIILPV